MGCFHSDSEVLNDQGLNNNHATTTTQSAISSVKAGNTKFSPTNPFYDSADDAQRSSQTNEARQNQMGANSELHDVRVVDERYEEYIQENIEEESKLDELEQEYNNF